MSTLQIEGDPTDVGMSGERLARIDTHFRKYVDDGRLPGWLISVSRHGKLVHLSTYGHRDIEAQAPVEVDTLWRIFSMTKPITAVLAMQLWEEGAFELNDPVYRYIPAFREQKVWRAGSSRAPVLDPIVEKMRLWHLMSHTSGLTY
jgi:CubicO group peptidase (beta-lactamase class C family)